MNLQELQENLRHSFAALAEDLPFFKVPTDSLPYYEEADKYRKIQRFCKKLEAEWVGYKALFDPEEEIRKIIGNALLNWLPRIPSEKVLVRLANLPKLRILKKHLEIFSLSEQYVDLIEEVYEFCENSARIQECLSHEVRGKNVRHVKRVVEKILWENLANDNLPRLKRLIQRIEKLKRDYMYSAEKIIKVEYRDPNGRHYHVPGYGK